MPGTANAAPVASNLTAGQKAAIGKKIWQNECGGTVAGLGATDAAYVYDLATTPPTRLFSVEDSSVELAPSVKESGDLLVIRNRWGARDDPCCPTDQTVELYRWNGVQFEVIK